MPKNFITCRLQRLVPCKRAALDLADVKDFLKIEHQKEDKLLEDLINAVAEKCELYTAKALLTQIWQADYQQFAGSFLRLPLSPVQAVEQILLFDFYHNQSTLPARLYRLHGDELQLLMPAMAGTLQLTIKVGYGDSPADIPISLRMTMLEHVAYLYENRASSQTFPLTKYDAFKPRRL